MKIDKNKYLKMIEAFLFVGSDLVDEKDIKLKIPKGINIKKYLSELKNIGAEIIGISSDSITNHQKFAKNFYVNYNLLSDYKKKVRKLFGVPKSFFGLLPGRVTYIFDPNRKLLKIINLQFDINSHITISKKIIKEYKISE